MGSCRTIQEHLTAWLDGELSGSWREPVRAHVESCADCAAQVESLRSSIELQRPVLAQLTAVPDLDVDAMSVRLRRAVATLDEAQSSGAWQWLSTSARWLFRPATLVGAAMAAGLVGVVLLAGGPDAVLIPLGVESPPVAVSSQPELFKDYPLIQHLDALVNFDTVESVPLEDDQAPQRG